ncbi:MAG: PAC2 family protein [Acidimicrobiales bacterium]|nr:PAC2 family protein [Acidimicrobiales bacterium]
MDHVQWAGRPRLRRPVLIAAFEGWNDAGDAATTAARWLRDRWDARAFASLDPEEFFDFTSTRPHVRLVDGVTREIVWPAVEAFAGAIPGTDRDAIVLLGTEPQLRWRTFCRQLTALATTMGVELTLTLGALLAEVAHSRPVSVIGTAADPDVVASLGLAHSRYEGPTGIVGVLHDAFRAAGIPSASLWAAVPAYVPGATSPKAALALVERTCHLLDVHVPTTELEIASAAYVRQIDELVETDEDMAAYVHRIEARQDDEDDEDDDDELPGDELVAEVERFLRGQDG